MRQTITCALFLLAALAPAVRAQQNSAANLLDSPVKVDREVANLGETVACTMALPGSLFGVDQIFNTSPTEFIGDEMVGSLFEYHLDETCALIGSWPNAWALPPSTQTGTSYDEATGSTYWVVDPITSGTIQQFTFGTGVPTATPPVALAPIGFGMHGPLAIDNNVFGGKLGYVEEIAADVATEYNLITGAVGCSFPNPDNASGSGAFGNGLSEAADTGACSGATMVISSGTITDGMVVRAGQTNCFGTLCPDTWDIGTPTLPFGETYVNGIEEYISATRGDKRLFAFGNATGTVFDIGRPPIGIADCQGIDSPDSDVVFANAHRGGASFTVAINNIYPLGLAIQKPPAGGNGKYVVHLNSGTPSSGTVTTMPASLGLACFPMIVPPGGSGAPVSVWNNIGKTHKVGASNYFGAAIPDPAKAPAFFHADPVGDPFNLPLGSQWTLQGIIINPWGTSPKHASMTNALILDVTAGI